MLTPVDDAHEGTHAAPDRPHGEGGPVDLDELFRLAAQQMLAVALEAERRAYLDAHAEKRCIASQFVDCPHIRARVVAQGGRGG